MEFLTCKVTVLGGGLWEVDGVMKVGALVNWTGALTKETPESSLAPPAV